MDDIQPKTRSAGQIAFVVIVFALSVILLAQITRQTAWAEDAQFAAQPRFWPGIALITMVAGFGIHLFRMQRRRPNTADWVELRRWTEPLEYMAWFMAYVFIVPVIGFLPVSIIFAVALTYRLGYRQRPIFLIAALFAVSVVVLFKGFLGVKIPGAALYELLPGGLRSFFILYL